MKKNKITKFNKTKHIKSLSRIETLGIKLGTRTEKVKTKYTRKTKYKKYHLVE